MQLELKKAMLIKGNEWRKEDMEQDLNWRSYYGIQVTWNHTGRFKKFWETNKNINQKGRRED